MTCLYPILGQDYPQRQYFVFTDAGKPVFISRPAEVNDDITSIAGIASALISVIADTTLTPSSYPATGPDKLRCINAGKTRITFFLRPPLYYVCVSKWGEPESIARMHLEYLHLQILSVLTAGQLKRIFERRTNFDLRRLLEGTETFMHTLINRLQISIALFTTFSSLPALRLDSTLRSRVGDGLVPKAGALDILYLILVYRDSIITIVRPKKHSVHPSDLYVLLNAINTSSVAANSASWLPICLPKFNPQGFVHAYVSYLEDDTTDMPSASTRITRNTGLALITVSGGGEFDAVRKWCETAVKKLEVAGLLSQLQTAVKTSSYSCSELGIPGLRHFVYKSRVHVQATSPVWDDEYSSSDDQKRLITLYQILHDAIHAKSGQAGSLRLQYIRTEKEAVLGWITQPFELYIAVSARLPKTAAVGAANAVARWAKREESKLFLRDAPVF
ncbi:hypothetical protein M422DRAFT_154257 [Sphaerobolus stellatus SS14]|nr:hypothetical protein M422DRAFT_154257 [Sphaerobolus stellatus SS14]